MIFNLRRMLDNKRAYRRALAARPIAEKLLLLDALRERSLALRPGSRAVRETPGEYHPRKKGAIRRTIAPVQEKLSPTDAAYSTSVHPPPTGAHILPDGWRLVPLGKIGDWFGGGTPSKANPKFWTNGTIPWVSPKDMKVDRITDTQDYITRDAIEQSATNLVPPGNLLVVVRSGILKHTLPVAITEREVALNQDLKAVTLHEGISSAYLALALKAFEQDILKTCTKYGTTVQNLNLPTFLRFPIPLAPPNQQRQIVAEIEKQFTRLAAGVAALKRVQANLKRYRAAVLKAACEGKLVPTEAELAKAEGREYETGSRLLARILAERRQKWQGRGKYKEPATHATTGLETLPEGWIWTTIGACFHVAVGATPNRNEASYWGGGIPWVSSGEVHFTAIVDTRETITKAGIENSSTQLNPRGSVLLGMIGEGKTRGQTAILKIDACNNQNCAAIWVSRTQVPPEYVYYWLWSQYDNTRRTSSGNNQPALNKARIEAMLLPLPPLAEQIRIVAEVERHLSVIEELETTVAANLQRAGRLRQAILQQAFSGRLPLQRN